MLATGFETALLLRGLGGSLLQAIALVFAIVRVSGISHVMYMVLPQNWGIPSPGTSRGGHHLMASKVDINATQPLRGAELTLRFRQPSG